MSPEIWRYVFDTIENPVFLHDAQFRVMLANRAYCRAAGVTEAQALGKPYWEVFPRGAGPLPGCKDAIIGEGHDGSQEEANDGGKLFFSRGYTVRDAQDKPIYALHVLNDITAQRQAEAALAGSEERFRRATETARDAIILLDGVSGVVIAWNPAAEVMFGYGKVEVIGRVLHEIIAPPRFRAVATKAMAHFSTTGEGAAINKTLELVALHKNGTEFPIELSLSATQLHGKWHATGIARDITERKQAQARIAYQAKLLTQVSEAIVASDEQYRITAWNAAAEAMYGWKAEEVLGRYGLEITRTEWAKADADEMRRLIDETGLWCGEVTQQRKDGTRFPVDISSMTLRDESGQITGYLSVNRGITERKAAEAQLAEQMEELRRWHAATSGREQRVLELKYEINELLGSSGQPPRYPSAESPDPKEE